LRHAAGGGIPHAIAAITSALFGIVAYRIARRHTGTAARRDLAEGAGISSTWRLIHAVGRSVIGLIGPLSTMASRCSAQPAPAANSVTDANTNRQINRMDPLAQPAAETMSSE
jgi:hypothetical protein